MTVDRHGGREERNAAFIARANSVRRFFQTVAMFMICIAGNVMAAVLDLPGLVVLMAALSTIPGTLSFIWLVEKFNPFGLASRPAIGAIQSIPIMAIALLISVAAVALASLQLSAFTGSVLHPLVYAAEFFLAVALVTRAQKRNAIAE